MDKKMKIGWMLLMASVAAVGQTQAVTTTKNTTCIAPKGVHCIIISDASDDDIELFRISLAVAKRICAADPAATPYIPLPKWTEVPCPALEGVMKAHSSFPDWIDEMHDTERRRQAAITELQKVVNSYMSKLPAASLKQEPR